MVSVEGAFCIPVCGEGGSIMYIRVVKDGVLRTPACDDRREHYVYQSVMTEEGALCIPVCGEGGSITYIKVLKQGALHTPVCDDRGGSIMYINVW